MKKGALLISLLMIIMMVFVGCSKKAESSTASSTSETKSTSVPATETAKSETTDSISGEFKPEKDITFVVGFDVGGTADIPARIIAKYMSKYAGVNVNVTNIVGSSGRIAAQRILDSTPDNHTLLHVPVGYYQQAVLGQANFTYEDFDTITLWCDSWVGLVVNANAPFKTYEEFVEYAKSHPGEVRLGAVAGTLPQIATLALMEKEGLDINVVDLGLNNKATELMGGRIDGYIDGIGQFKQYVDSGNFNCLMAFGYAGTDFPGYEGLPAAGDLGYEEFDFLLQSFGMWAAKGTDPKAIEYYANLIKQVSEDTDCIAELNALGYDTAYMEPEEYNELCGEVLAQTEEALQGYMN